MSRYEYQRWESKSLDNYKDGYSYNPNLSAEENSHISSRVSQKQAADDFRETQEAIGRHVQNLNDPDYVPSEGFKSLVIVGLGLFVLWLFKSFGDWLMYDVLK